MSYEPHTWVAGETVTPSKLNNIEQGIVNNSGVMIVNDNVGTLDATWQEIYDAMEAGTPVFIKREQVEQEDISL